MTNNREVCENCGKFLVPEKWQSDDYADYECDGVMSFETDPYAIEINDDYTLYWNCDGGRYESAMDI